jgi:hypothetical protein
MDWLGLVYETHHLVLFPSIVLVTTVMAVSVLLIWRMVTSVGSAGGDRKLAAPNITCTARISYLP